MNETISATAHQPATHDHAVEGLAGYQPNVRGHLPSLDGVRGIAILMVMIAHFIESDMERVGGPLRSVLSAIHSVGFLGVDLFFVLSGFLITGIALDKVGTKGFLLRFYARRTLRIFPLYYLALVIVFFIYPLLHVSTVPTVTNQLWLYFYCSNIGITFFGKVFPFVEHFWSLAVEEHFYLFWPTLLVLTPHRRLPVLGGALIVLAVVSRFILQHFGYETYHFTLCRMDALIMGGMLALAMRSDAGLVWVRRLSRVVPVLLVVVALLGVYTLLKTTGLSRYSEILRYSGVAALFTLFVLIAVRTNPRSVLGRVLASRALRLFGLYSYGLYVYHSMLLAFMDHWFDSSHFSSLPGVLPAIILRVVLCMAFSALVAVTSYHLIEQPILGLKRFFDYDRRTA